MKHCLAIILCLLLYSCRPDYIIPCVLVPRFKDSDIQVIPLSSGGWLQLGDTSSTRYVYQDTGSYIIMYYQDTTVAFWSYGSSNSSPQNDYTSWQMSSTSIFPPCGKTNCFYPNWDSATLYLRYAKSLDSSRICTVGFDTLHFHN